MGIADAIKQAETLDDIATLSECLERLIERRRNEIIKSYEAQARRVGFVYKAKTGKGRYGKTKEVKCSGVVVENHRTSVTVQIVAPANMSGKAANVPKPWLVDTFVERVAPVPGEVPFA